MVVYGGHNLVSQYIKFITLLWISHPYRYTSESGGIPEIEDCNLNT